MREQQQPQQQPWPHAAAPAGQWQQPLQQQQQQQAGADPNLLVDLDDELLRRLEAAGVSNSGTAAAWGAAPAGSATDSAGAAAPPGAARAAAPVWSVTRPQLGQASGSSSSGLDVVFEPVEWTRGRGEADAGAAEAPAWRRRPPPGVQVDPWAPPPSEAAVRWAGF